MARQTDKLELAWLVTTTEELLARLRVKRTYAGSDAENALRLTHQQRAMVLIVHEQGCLTVRRLTRALGVNASSVSIMVERLVELGILTREENPLDRREVLVRVAASREGSIERLKREYVEVTIDVFDRIGMESAQSWGAVCRRIRETYAGEQTFGKECGLGGARDEDKAAGSNRTGLQRRADSESGREREAREVRHGR